MIRPIIRLSETDPTLWEELGAWFKEWFNRTFSTGYNDYQHIQMGTGTIVTLRNIVLGLFIGLIIAACVAFYDKNRLGAFVRKLVKDECLWPEKAKTLGELGFLKNPGVRNSLKRGKVLGNTVHCVEKEQYQAEVEAARQAYIEKTGSEDGFGMLPAGAADDVAALLVTHRRDGAGVHQIDIGGLLKAHHLVAPLHENGLHGLSFVLIDLAAKCKNSKSHKQNRLSRTCNWNTITI